MKRILLSLVIIFTSLELVVAQDFHSSQFEISPLMLNPANTGFYNGEFRAHLQYRSQWGSVTKYPFRTEQFSFDKPFKRFGAGIIINNNRAGIGKYNFLNIALSGSYEVTIDPSKVQHLVFGAQIAMVQNSFDLTELTFDNQYTSAFGGSFDQNIDNGETFEKTSVIRPDVNFGVFYMKQEKLNFFNYSVYKLAGLVPYGGISFFHLTQPSLSFGTEKSRLPRRFVAYAGAKYKVTIPLCVEPQILYMRQAKNNEFQFKTSAYYYIKDIEAFAFTTLNYRAKDAFILSLGAMYKEYKFCVGYDFNTSQLKRLTNSTGSFEISFTYTKLTDKNYAKF